MDYIDRNYHALISMMNQCKETFSNFAIPLKHTWEFDLIGMKKGQLMKIRIICTESRQPSGSYIANLLKSGGYRDQKEIKKHFNKDDCDYLFISTPEYNYLIPSENINVTKALTLSSDWNEYILPN